MFRFVAIAALAAAVSFPAFAEPGSVKRVSLPALDASYVLTPKTCELPTNLSAPAAPLVPAASHAMTLSPRMLQAIRIDDDVIVN